MKKTMKKVLALVLTVLMCVSVVLPVMAESATSGCPGVGVAHTLENCTNYETHKTYAPTCEKDGYTHYQCKVCDVYFADSWVDRPTANGLCVWEVTTKASCFTDGVKTCKNCGDTQAIPKRSHTLSPVAGSPDCGVPGAKVTYECTNVADRDGLYEACNYTEQRDAGDAHDWIITVTVQPSCGVKGEATYTCEDCTFSKTMEIYSTGDHDLETVNAKAETCTKDGNLAHEKCKDCGLLIMGGNVVEEEDVVVEAHHTYDAQNPTAIVYPTCTTPGFKFYGCTVCGQTAATDTLPMLPHITNEADRGETDANEVTLVGTLVSALNCATDTDEVYKYTCVGNRCAEDTNTAPVHTTTFEWQVTTLEVGSEEAEEAGHEIAPEVVDPNCTEGGYTYMNCEICGQIGEEYDETDPIEDAHVWANSAYINAPSCTAPGTAVSYCTKCNEVDNNHAVNALGHSWEREGVSLDDLTPVLNCKLGVWEYECTECTDLEGRIHTEVYENFNIDDIKCHISYDPTEDDKWTGTINNFRTGDCTVGSIDIYTCSCGYSVSVVGEASHTKPSVVNAYVAPYCLSEGRYGSWTCTVCDGTAYTDADGEIVVFVEDGDELPEGFAVVIPMLSTTGEHLNKTVYKAAAGATCTADGNTEGWYCNVCCNFVNNNNAPTITLKSGNATVNATKPEYVMSVVEGRLNHRNSAMDDYAHITISGAVITRVPTCLEYAYAHYVCDDCGYEYWDNYKKELGHDTEEKEIAANCDEGGYNLVICKRGELCDLTATTFGANSYKVVEKEAVARLEHKDAEGNDIKCVFEDFYCSVCSPRVDGDGDPVLDAEGEQIMDIVDWERSHDYETKYYNKTCVSYGYTLISCTSCNDGKVVQNTVDGFGAHNYAADTNPATGTHPYTDENGKTWTVTKDPSYTAVGSKYQKCTVCGDKKVDDNYALEEVAFSLNADNGIVAGTQIVNSGLIALTVKTSAYKMAVGGIQFSVFFDNQLVEFVPSMTKVHNADFATTTFANAQNIMRDSLNPSTNYVDRDEVVTVAAYTPKTTAGKLQNVELNGEEADFVTLYFRVLPTAIDTIIDGQSDNAVYFMFLDTVLEFMADEMEDDFDEFVETNFFEPEMIFATMMNGSTIVVEADEDKTPVDAVYYDVEKYDEDRYEDVDFDELYCINVGEIAVARLFAIGDVTGDYDVTATGFATVVDALAIKEIVESNGKYNAMADIDKDGKITVNDMAYLMKYISGEIGYNELCALGVNA